MHDTEEEADGAAGAGRWEAVGTYMAIAERHARCSDPVRCSRALDGALRALGAGGSFVADDEAETWAERVVRGVLYHNVGVARTWNGRNGDSWLAAAQCALAKAGGVVHLLRGACMARCVAMARGGRREDAARHWLAQRRGGACEDDGSEASDGADDDEDDGVARMVIFGASHKEVQRMDKACKSVCAGADARARGEATAAEL